jgi:hypothetical protein
MAQKRMFDRSITDTEQFMDMPMSSKALYFLLGMEADDEGFASARKVMKIHGGTEDDLKILIAKGYVIRFESGVIVVTHWHDNNYLDRNRIKATQYQKEKKQLQLTKFRTYELNNGSTSTVQRRREENRIEEKKASKEAGNANADELDLEARNRKMAEARENLVKRKSLL